MSFPGASILGCYGIPRNVVALLGVFVPYVHDAFCSIKF